MAQLQSKHWWKSSVLPQFGGSRQLGENLNYFISAPWISRLNVKIIESLWALRGWYQKASLLLYVPLNNTGSFSSLSFCVLTLAFKFAFYTVAQIATDLTLFWVQRRHCTESQGRSNLWLILHWNTSQTSRPLEEEEEEKKSYFLRNGLGFLKEQPHQKPQMCKYDVEMHSQSLISLKTYREGEENMQMKNTQSHRHQSGRDEASHK